MHLMHAGGRCERADSMRVGVARCTPEARTGFSLPELIVSLVLLGLVMGSMMTLLMRQQRFYRSANEIVDARTQVRQAIDMVPADLRVLSSSDVRNGTDIYASTDNTIDFRAITGSAVLCKITNLSKILIPPTNLTAGTALTTWIDQPQAGDSMFIYDDSAATGNGDDHWNVYGINAVGSNGGCGLASGLVRQTDVDAGLTGYSISLATPMTATISIGAPIRFFRRRRYELYQPSGSSSWYLGMYDCRSSCATLSPVSGPFAAYSATAGSTGLRFTYLDSLGNELTPTSITERAKIARIQLTARADTRAPVDIPGRPKATVRDSLTLDITLRNRQ
jgi:prepilin-type N-terminal cleavage/methylation domain-containing protein